MPSKEQIDYLVETLCQRYPKTRPHFSLNVETVEEVDWNALARYVQSFMMFGIRNPDSSPGYPYCYEYAKNKDFIAAESNTIVLLVCYRIWLLLNISIDDLRAMPPYARWRAGLVDPTRVFVKNEPHKKKKAENQAWRMIHNYSLVDQLVGSVLYHTQDKAEIANWKDYPSKVGIGFEDSDNTAVIHSIQMGKLYGLIEIRDASNWDYTVKMWQLEADAKRRVLLALARNTMFQKLMENWTEDIAIRVIITSNGMVFVMIIRGSMGSGDKKTSSGNCFITNLNSAYQSLVNNDFLHGQLQWWSMSMGDDCIARHYANGNELLGRLGHINKESTMVGDYADFCSHRYYLDGRKTEFINFGKTMFYMYVSVQRNNLDAQMVEARLRELRNQPDLQRRIIDYARENGVDITAGGAVKN